MLLAPLRSMQGRLILKHNQGSHIVALKFKSAFTVFDLKTLPAQNLTIDIEKVQDFLLFLNRWGKHKKTVLILPLKLQEIF